MANFKLQRLNQRAASAKYKADQILQTLAIQPGMVIADLGSGGGFFAYQFAQAAAPDGKVYAVDSETDYLAYIQHNADKMGLKNLQTFQTSQEQLELPPMKFDLIFSRNMVHHLEDAPKYFSTVSRFLKPAGKLAVIDYYDSGRFSLRFFRLHHHYTQPEVILDCMRHIGLERCASYDFLPEQSFQIFTLPK